MHSDNQRSLLKVANGLGLLYAAMCTTLLAAFAPLLGGILFGQQGFAALNLILMSTVILWLIASGLDIVGRLMCLAMPTEKSGARQIVFVSVACSSVPFLLFLIQLGQFLIPYLRLPIWIGLLQIPLALLGSVLFLVFLRLLANYVGEPKLAKKVTSILLLGVVGLLVAIYLYGAPFANLPPIGPIGMLVFVVFGLVLLISYGNLLNYLRKAVSKFAIEGGLGFDELVEKFD